MERDFEEQARQLFAGKEALKELEGEVRKQEWHMIETIVKHGMYDLLSLNYSRLRRMCQ